MPWLFSPARCATTPTTAQVRDPGAAVCPHFLWAVRSLKGTRCGTRAQHLSPSCAPGAVPNDGHNLRTFDGSGCQSDQTVMSHGAGQLGDVRSRKRRCARRRSCHLSLRPALPAGAGAKGKRFWPEARNPASYNLLTVCAECGRAAAQWAPGPIQRSGRFARPSRGPGTTAHASQTALAAVGHHALRWHYMYWPELCAAPPGPGPGQALFSPRHRKTA